MEDCVNIELMVHFNSCTGLGYTAIVVILIAMEI